MEKRRDLSRRDFLKLVGTVIVGTTIVPAVLEGCVMPWPDTLTELGPTQVSAGVTAEPYEGWMYTELPSPNLFIEFTEKSNFKAYFLDSDQYRDLPADEKERIILKWLAEYFNDDEDGKPNIFTDLKDYAIGIFEPSMEDEAGGKVNKRKFRILAANGVEGNLFFLGIPDDEDEPGNYKDIMAIKVPVSELHERSIFSEGSSGDEAIMAKLLADLVNNLDKEGPNKRVAMAIAPGHRKELDELLNVENLDPRLAFVKLFENHSEIPGKDEGVSLYKPEVVTAERIITGKAIDWDSYAAEQKLITGTEVKIRKFVCLSDSNGQLRYYAVVSLNKNRNAALGELYEKTIENYFVGHLLVPVDSLVIERHK